MMFINVHACCMFPVASQCKSLVKIVKTMSLCSLINLRVGLSPHRALFSPLYVMFPGRIIIAESVTCSCHSRAGSDLLMT